MHLKTNNECFLTVLFRVFVQWSVFMLNFVVEGQIIDFAINLQSYMKVRKRYGEVDRTIHKVTIIWHRNPGRLPKAQVVGWEHHKHKLSGVRHGVWGSVVSSPSAGPPMNFFRYTVYKDKIWANFWPPMRKQTAAEMGKSRQIRGTKPKTGQMGVPGELWFFSGHVIKNQDCPRKSSTDDHLS